MRSVLLLSVVGLLVAGCLAPIDPQPSEGVIPTQPFGKEVTKVRAAALTGDLSKIIDTTHGGAHEAHAVPELHKANGGMTEVGYNPLTQVMNGPSITDKDAGFAAIDTWHQYACVTRFAGLGGATIVDITDPAAPKVLSNVESGMLNSDCQFTDDGDYLLLASYTGTHPGLPLVPPPLADAGANGVLVYDVKDKAKPIFLFHDVQGADAPAAGSYHNVFTATIHDMIYIFQTFSGNILSFTPGDGALKLVSKVEKADHDMWVGQHPVTGAWIMITGAGGGTRIYDMADPANPTVLGEWAPHDGLTGWHRQWPLLDTVEGRALMVVAGEDCTTGHSRPYTVLDFTDPADIIELGNWQIPGKPQAPASPAHLCEFSAHEFETWNGYVATGNYHAGVWLIDIGTMERAKAPVVIGYYLPDEVPATNGGSANTPFKWNPYVWGGYFDERGYVVAADMFSGLYVFKFEATPG